MMAIPYCLWLETHPICLALRLALARAGKSNAARMAMIAITTSNSIRVNPRILFLDKTMKLNAAYSFQLVYPTKVTFLSIADLD